MFNIRRFRVNYWSCDCFICLVFWFSLLYLNLNSFLINCRSGYFLFIISISRNINSLYSFSCLNYSFSCNWISCYNFIRLINVINLNLFFLGNWLNISLSYVLICRKCITSWCRIISSLNRSINSR